VILLDTSVWVDHLRANDPAVAGLLVAGEVIAHPFVIGELALARLEPRDAILHALDKLPRAVVASDSEVLRFIDNQRLTGLGIGYVDAHLLAAVQLTPEARIWTRDKRLQGVADRLGLSLNRLY